VRLLLLFLFSFGCAGAIHTPTTISHRFSPDPEIEQSVRRALVRWTAATGIGLLIEDTGTPVVVIHGDYAMSNGKIACGSTNFTDDVITVTTKREKCDYWSFDSLVLHEIGHKITMSPGHSASGIMAPGGRAENRECIDEDSLSHICAGANCEIFVPEC